MTYVSTCLHHALEIQTRIPPREWPAALERVPAECREECETYLRSIAQRMRVARANAHLRGKEATRRNDHVG